MLEENPLITSLESKIDDLHRDRSTARKIVGSNSNLLTVNTAIEEYVILKQDSTIPLGIRYLALSCIAAHYQLYQDNREISQLKDLTGQAINLPTHAEVFSAIQVIKSSYYQIYDCDNREFDRLERLTKEMSPESISKIEQSHITDRNNLTDLEIEKIRAEERAKSFKISLFVVVMFSIGGGSGVVANLVMRQQPQPVSTNANQSNVSVPPNTTNLLPTEVQTPSTPDTSDSAPAVIATPSPTETVAPSPSPVAVATPDPRISQDEAISLVQRWLEAKKTLFAPPFDRESAASITTGKAYTDKVRGPSSDGTPDSSSQWLEKYGYYYSYGVQKIDRANNFIVNGNTGIIDITITEDVTLYNSKGELQKDKSGLEQKTIRYKLIEENGTLKISDYNNLTASKIRL
jgi:ARC6-like, IMS domain